MMRRVAASLLILIFINSISSCCTACLPGSTQARLPFLSSTISMHAMKLRIWHSVPASVVDLQLPKEGALVRPRHLCAQNSCIRVLWRSYQRRGMAGVRRPLSELPSFFGLDLFVSPAFRAVGSTHRGTTGCSGPQKIDTRHVSPACSYSWLKSGPSKCLSVVYHRPTFPSDVRAVFSLDNTKIPRNAEHTKAADEYTKDLHTR